MTVAPPTRPDPNFVPSTLREDEQLLTMLGIFSYVLAGLTALGGCASLIYVGIGVAMLVSSRQAPPDEGDPTAVLGVGFAVFGGIVLVVCLVGAVLMFMTGQAFRHRRHKLLIQIVAGLSCLNIPIGTAYGIMTFIVLGRPGVKRMFEANFVQRGVETVAAGWKAER